MALAKTVRGLKTITLCAILAATAGGQTIRMNIGEEPADLDPQLAAGSPARQVLSALFESLVVPDPVDLHPLPGIADRWNISADGLTYTFHIRDNARWSDGKKITADDFVDSYRRLLSPAFPGRGKSLLYPLRNAESFAQGKIADFAQVGVRKKDPQTLELILVDGQPAPYLLKSIAINYQWDPVPMHVVSRGEENGPLKNTWTKVGSIVTDGPCTLSELKHEQYIAAKKSATYWDEENVRFDEIKFYPVNGSVADAMFRTDKLDIATGLQLDRLNSYRHMDGAKLLVGPYASIYAYVLNVNAPELADAKVRAALSAAIDREAIVKLANAGQTPAYSWAYPGLGGYVDADNSLPAQSTKIANKPSQLYLQYFYDSNQDVIAQAIQQMWTNAGFTVSLDRSGDMKTLVQNRRAGKYQIAVRSWTADFDDESTFLDLFVSDNPNNVSGYKNLQYDQLVRDGKRAVLPQQRNEYYKHAAHILSNDAVVIPIYYMSEVIAVKNNISGIQPNAFGTHPVKSINIGR